MNNSNIECWAKVGICLLLGLSGVLALGPVGKEQNLSEDSLGQSYPKKSDRKIVESNRTQSPEQEILIGLPGLARRALEYYFATGQILTVSEKIPQDWQDPKGVFVTLSQNGQTRGCWGTLEPTAPDLGTATIRAALGAAQRDWRYPPLRPEELLEVSIQVAIIQSVTPVSAERLLSLDPTRVGLFVRSGSQGAVLLPGEALTPQWQLATAQRLAQIPDSQTLELFQVQAKRLHETTH
jgi:uncharacterized protein (TIGR00296 family)